MFRATVERWWRNMAASLQLIRSLCTYKCLLQVNENYIIILLFLVTLYNQTHINVFFDYLLRQ